MTDQQAPVNENDVINPALEEALEQAILQCASKGAMATQAQDVKDYAESALKFAQALIITNPELVAPQGVPIDALNPSGMNPLAPPDLAAGSSRSVSGRSGPSIPPRS